MSEYTSRLALERCQFCGGTYCMIDRDPIDNHRWRVFCMEDECGAQGPSRSTQHEAIAAWNTRAKPVVKELAWGGEFLDTAKTPFATYGVTDVGEGRWRFYRSSYPYVDESDPIYETEAEAKAAAQADFARRVHACLEGYDD